MSFRFVMPALIAGSIIYSLTITSSASAMRIEYRGVEYIYRNGKCVGTHDYDQGVSRAGCN
jgi:hypothetical protein